MITSNMALFMMNIVVHLRLLKINHRYFMNAQKLLRLFRYIAIAEGVSYLALLGIAMPLKYLSGNLLVIKYLGWVHGLLFILFCTFLAFVKFKMNWTILKSLRAFVASLLPFGTFIFDKEIKQEIKQF